MGCFKRFFRRFLNRLSYLHFNGKAFTIFIIYFIVFILLCFNTTSSAFSTSDVGHIDTVMSNTSFVTWLSSLPEYNNSNYIYLYAWCYPNSGNIQTNNAFYAVFIDKQYYLEHNVKAFLTQGNQNTNLFYINFSTSTYLVERSSTNLNFRSYGLYNYCSAPLISSNGNINMHTDIPIIYRNNSYNSIFYQSYTYPYITTSTSDIESWSFDNLEIDGGDVSPYWQNISTTPIYYQNYRFYLDITTNGITYSNDIYKFVEINNDTDTFYITIPRQALSSYFNINDGQSVNFYLRLKAVLSNGEVYEDDGFDLGTYTLTLTSQQVTDINNESDKYTQGSIEENQKETNEKLDDLNSSINNSDISDITNDTLPSDDTQDITADGVNGIFTSIYNAFCTGTPQDIVFPVPFTNKNITLSPNYVVDMLTSSGATFVITLIQAFWWYLISRFIVKDVMNKINKIKSGNIEKIEETNIRGDML